MRPDYIDKRCSLNTVTDLMRKEGRRDSPSARARVLLKQNLTEFRGEIDQQSWRLTTPFSAQVTGRQESQWAEDSGTHPPGSTQRFRAVVRKQQRAGGALHVYKLDGGAGTPDKIHVKAEMT